MKSRWAARAATALGVFLLAVYPLKGDDPGQNTQQVQRAAEKELRAVPDSPKTREIEVSSHKRIVPESDEERFLAKLRRLLKKGRWQKIEGSLEKHINEHGDSARLYLLVGRLYFDHEQWERAAELLRRSIQMQNPNPMAHFLLGLCLSESKQIEAAQKELGLAASQDPRNGLYRYMAGNLHYTQGRYKSALSYFYDAARLNPNNLKALHGLALTHTRLGNYEMAESYYYRAMEIAEKQGDPAGTIPLDLAYLLLLSHNPDKAAEGLKWARRAVSLDSSSSAAHYLLGKAQFRLGHEQDALDSLKKAARLNPDDPKPHLLLGRLYARLGKRKEANEHWQTFARLNQSRRPESGPSTGKLR